MIYSEYMKILCSLFTLIAIITASSSVYALETDPNAQEIEYSGGGNNVSNTSSPQQTTLPNLPLKVSVDTSGGLINSRKAGLNLDWDSVRGATQYKITSTITFATNSYPRTDITTKTRYFGSKVRNPDGDKGYCGAHQYIVEALSSSGSVIARGKAERCITNSGKQEGLNPVYMSAESTGLPLGVSILSSQYSIPFAGSTPFIGATISWNQIAGALRYNVFGFTQKADGPKTQFSKTHTTLPLDNIGLTIYQNQPLSEVITFASEIIGCTTISATVEAMNTKGERIARETVSVCVDKNGNRTSTPSTDDGRGSTGGTNPTAGTSTVRTLLSIRSAQRVEPGTSFPVIVSYSPSVKTILVETSCTGVSVCPQRQLITGLSASGGSTTVNLGTAPSVSGSSYLITLEARDTQSTVLGRISKRMEFIAKNGSAGSGTGREGGSTIDPVKDPYVPSTDDSPPYRFDPTLPDTGAPAYSDRIPATSQPVNPSLSSGGADTASYSSQQTPSRSNSSGSLDTRASLQAQLNNLIAELKRRQAIQQDCSYTVPYRYPLTLNVCPVK